MKPEILAPCGTYTALKQAVYNGADAVYFGLKSFNARIRADNFTIENLVDVVQFCHIYGVKAYITVNTAIKNNEIEKLEALILACKKANVDAFIISDLAVYDVIYKIAPEIPMHASTQMGICNLEGAKFIESLGFTRVVLARETTYKDIINISQNTKLKLEYFIQGALCVAFSGKCLLSSIINGNSGNRGKCLQPCRLKYRSVNGNKGYLLSTSDLCLANHLKKLVDSGISSFKIEGRLRRDSYVRDTVKAYRKIIDNNFIVDKSDLFTLKKAYNRGDFSSGYAFEEDTNNIMSTKIQGNIGVCAGNVVEVFNKNNKTFAKILPNFKIKVNDGYKLIDNNGFEVSGGRLNTLKYENGHYIAQVDKAKKGYALNITSTKTEEIIKAKIPINMHFEIDENRYASLCINNNNIKVKINIDKPYDIADNIKLTENYIKGQLSKLGNTNFILNDFSFNVLSNVFIPISELNNLRREAVIKLEQAILNNYNITKKVASLPKKPKSIINKGLIHNTIIALELQTAEQLSSYVVNNADIIIYYPFEFNLTYTKQFLKKVLSLNNKAKIYIKLTPNANIDDIKVYRNILDNTANELEGIMADNYYCIELAKDYNLKIFGGIGLNIFNTKIFDYINLESYIVSAELNLSEIKLFESPFLFAYGYLPLMNFSHCVQKLNNNNTTCSSCTYNKKISYVDRFGYSFDIFRNKVNSCYFTLYNAMITDISSKIGTFPYNLYLNMLQCDNKEIEKVLMAFINKKPLKNDNFTYGHLFRGVE